MRYMIIRKADADTEAMAMPTEQLMTDMGAYLQSMADAGILLAGDGLHASAKGARVRFSGGEVTVIDGPFTEAKELVAGFSAIDVPSLEDAIAWAKRWPASDGGGNVRLEVRKFTEAEDFGEAFTPELQDAEQQLRERAAANQE
jgi:hypothetical protein